MKVIIDLGPQRTQQIIATSKRSYDDLLSPLGTKINDHGAYLQTLLSGVRLRLQLRQDMNQSSAHSEHRTLYTYVYLLLTNDSSPVNHDVL